MAWIDTTYFDVAGVKVHVVGAMEAFSRMVLAGEVFVQERAETSTQVLSQALGRVPELEAIVRDRGTPYLNEKVDTFLGERGAIPINAHAYFPVDKAALERWWRTLKEWLRLAVEPYERQGKKIVGANRLDALLLASSSSCIEQALVLTTRRSAGFSRFGWLRTPDTIPSGPAVIVSDGTFVSFASSGPIGAKEPIHDFLVQDLPRSSAIVGGTTIADFPPKALSPGNKGLTSSSTSRRPRASGFEEASSAIVIQRCKTKRLRFFGG